MAKEIPWRRYAGERAIALVLIAVLIAITIPDYVSPPGRNISAFNACVNNLHQLDGAAEQWRLENNRATNALPTLAEAGVYVQSTPVCPTGGTYRYDPNSGMPTCSIPGHVLP